VGKAVDREGRPLPWYTYPAIHLLEKRLPPGSEVFEFGAGHSTYWYSAHCRRVVSVEHDPAWYDQLRGSMPTNVELALERDPELYASASSRRGEQYDLVAVDGELRAECAADALRSLKPEGVIIWDNSDWEPFLSTFPAVLEPAGFRQLELRGTGPVAPITWSTSILYRSGSNCLGI
jgi:hypothetical protein